MRPQRLRLVTDPRTYRGAEKGKLFPKSSHVETAYHLYQNSITQFQYLCYGLVMGSNQAALVKETEMTQHTPMPWRYVCSNGSPTSGPHMIAGDKPGFLAEVRDCGSGDVKANAHLIAAAPDLLAALQDALPVLEHSVTCFPPAKDATQEYLAKYALKIARLEAAKAAISKAKGVA